MKKWLNYRLIYKISGPLIFVFFILVHPLQSTLAVNQMMGIVLWVALWWLTECVHLAVTSLLPLVLFPMCSIASVKEIAQQYSDSIIFLFLGVFLISIAIEKWDLHKRIARNILLITGRSVDGLVGGIMISAYLLSNWISNTATVLMLFGTIMALLNELESMMQKRDYNYLSASLMLGMAYAASIGGMATPVGTPPNMYFFKMYPKLLNNSIHISFAQWMVFFIPLSLLILVGCFFILKILFLDKISVKKINTEHFELHHKYKITYEEKVISTVFIFTVLLWLTRDINISAWHIKGWKYWFKHSEYVDDSIVAIASAVLLFIIPSKKNPDETILMGEDIKRLKYDILLLFGGGFALAYGFEKSGLINFIVQQLNFVKTVHPLILILFISVMIVTISEFASNIATIQLALPIIASMLLHFSSDMYLKLMLPCVLSASVGFMLPIATPPNTIAFGSGKIPLSFMLKAGFYLDVFSIFTIAIYCYLFL